MLSPRRSSFVIAGLVVSGLLAVYAGCGGGSDTTTSSGSSSTSTSTSSGESSSSTSGAASSSGASSSSSSSSSGGASSSSTSSTTSSSSSSGMGGMGGAGGAGGGWPTCDMKPMGVPSQTIHDVWVANPAKPTQVWMPGVFITAISASGCQSGVACQIFVQSAEQFPDLASGSQQAIKLFISAATAQHFTGLAVGDKVDVLGWPWRYNLNGQNELLVEVNLMLKGCAKKVGTGAPMPVKVTLADLTVDAYENTVGPLFITIDKVSGKPAMPGQTFGLWDTGTFSDAGIDTVTSLSPFFLPTQQFVGLVQGKVHDFTSVTGVFGLFVQNGMKYEELYPRQTSEYPVAKVH